MTYQYNRFSYKAVKFFSQEGGDDRYKGDNPSHKKDIIFR